MRREKFIYFIVVLLVNDKVVLCVLKVLKLEERRRGWEFVYGYDIIMLVKEI